MKRLIIAILLTSSLSAMQSSFNNDFNMRFGPDSHEYNTPLYFGSLSARTERLKQHRKEAMDKKNAHRKMSKKTKPVKKRPAA